MSEQDITKPIVDHDLNKDGRPDIEAARDDDNSVPGLLKQKYFGVGEMYEVVTRAALIGGLAALLGYKVGSMAEKTRAALPDPNKRMYERSLKWIFGIFGGGIGAYSGSVHARAGQDQHKAMKGALKDLYNENQELRQKLSERGEPTAPAMPRIPDSQIQIPADVMGRAQQLGLEPMPGQ